MNDNDALEGVYTQDDFDCLKCPSSEKSDFKEEHLDDYIYSYLNSSAGSSCLGCELKVRESLGFSDLCDP